MQRSLGKTNQQLDNSHSHSENQQGFASVCRIFFRSQFPVIPATQKQSGPGFPSPDCFFKIGVPTGIRTPVATVKG